MPKSVPNPVPYLLLSALSCVLNPEFEAGDDSASELATCGDGHVEAKEECDLGIDNRNDGPCTDACTLASCGDGMLHSGVEQCDDANIIAGDGCSPVCMLEQGPMCGDGVVDEGEECDHGEANDSWADCTEECTIQICGDGFLGTAEACDDGNHYNNDGCSTECMVEFCGDGITQPGEECDDGNAIDLDGCSSQCTYIDVRRVFATSTLYTGAINGVVGADHICNTRAQAANLPGNYMAWISTNANNVPLTPASRFMHSVVPYVMVDGTKVADNWNDLTDGSLDHGISLTEFGQPTPETGLTCDDARVVRTGTAPDGTLGVDLGRCNNFTQADGMAQGTIGHTTSSIGEWSQCGDRQLCLEPTPIYCFQQ